MQGKGEKGNRLAKFVLEKRSQKHRIESGRIRWQSDAANELATPKNAEIGQESRSLATTDMRKRAFNRPFRYDAAVGSNVSDPVVNLLTADTARNGSRANALFPQVLFKRIRGDPEQWNRQCLPEGLGFQGVKVRQLNWSIASLLERVAVQLLAAFTGSGA